MVLEGAVLQRVVDRREDIVGLVALAKREDPASVVRRRPRLGALEPHQEAIGRIADLAVRDAQLLEVRAAVRLGPMARGDHELSRAAWSELVLGHQLEVLGRN